MAVFSVCCVRCFPLNGDGKCICCDRVRLGLVCVFSFGFAEVFAIMKMYAEDVNESGCSFMKFIDVMEL